MDHHKFQQAAQSAMDLLQHKMLPAFTYHNKEHTLAVVNACARLAELEGIDEEDQHLLLLAAYFHDTGLTTISNTDPDTYQMERAIHEEKAVQIARDVLSRYHFQAEEIETVARLIMATKRDHAPVDLMEQIIADADLSSLGQAPKSFMRSSDALLKELRSFGIQIKDAEWYKDQKQFIETCVYYTESAQHLFDKNRLLNMAAMQSRMKTLHS